MYIWGFLYQNNTAKNGLASSNSLTIEERDGFVIPQSLLASGPLVGLQIEERVNRQCARFVNLIDREFFPTSVDHWPMKLAVAVRHFVTSVLGELLWSQLLFILSQGITADTSEREAMEESLHHLCVYMSRLGVSHGWPASLSRTPTRRSCHTSKPPSKRVAVSAPPTRPLFLGGSPGRARRFRPPGPRRHEDRPQHGRHHALPDVLGYDAKVFRPELWLEAETTASRAMHDTLDVL